MTLQVEDRVEGSLVPRPHPREEERVWYLTSEFLVVLSQHAYGNFVMQRDSHVTAVAHLFRVSSARCAYVYKGGAAFYL